MTGTPQEGKKGIAQCRQELGRVLDGELTPILAKEDIPLPVATLDVAISKTFVFEMQVRGLSR